MMTVGELMIEWRDEQRSQVGEEWSVIEERAKKIENMVQEASLRTYIIQQVWLY